jgi:hypothetical protein
MRICTVLILSFMPLLNACVRSAQGDLEQAMIKQGVTLKGIAAKDFVVSQGDPATPKEVMTFTNKSGELIQFNRMDSQSEADAVNFMNIKKQAINSLFAAQSEAYTGLITNKISCLKGQNVNRSNQRQAKGAFVFFDLMATSRFVYGTCLENEELYKSQYLLLYCSDRKAVFQLKYFFAKNREFPSQPVAECI